MKNIIILLLLLIPSICFSGGFSSENVKCPVCIEQGLKSNTAIDGGCVSTNLAGGYTWFDENEEPHYCDPNIISCWFICSEGHTFLHTFENDCLSEEDTKWVVTPDKGTWSNNED